MVNKFTNNMGTRYLKGLFYETTGSDKSSVLYTLKDEDHEVQRTVDGKASIISFPSLYRLYMETNDPTEYQFATNHLDGWSHWEQLSECSWFKPYVERWRRELELRMKSQALSRIMKESKAGGREAFTANKYLLEKGWVPKDSPGRGRPSRDEINKEARRQVDMMSSLNEHAERLGIKVQ